jgi:preprotein translocase subunit SecG
LLYILYALFFISCVLLIGSVLLQPGKTDAGALFTSNVSSTAFAPRGTASVLAKFTIGAAIVFMISALMISMPALSGNVSVLSGNEEVPAETAPAAPGTTTENPVPVTQATIGPGEEQQITIGPDGTANSAPQNNTAPASNSNNRIAVPVQPNPPSNQ